MKLFTQTLTVLELFHIRLLFGANILPDNRRFFDYNVCNGSTIFLYWALLGEEVVKVMADTTKSEKRPWWSFQGRRKSNKKSDETLWDTLNWENIEIYDAFQENEKLFFVIDKKLIMMSFIPSFRLRLLKATFVKLVLVLSFTTNTALLLKRFELRQKFWWLESSDNLRRNKIMSFALNILLSFLKKGLNQACDLFFEELSHFSLNSVAKTH